MWTNNQMKACNLLLLIFLVSRSIQKDEKQFFLDDNVNLQSELGKDYIYHRIKLTENELRLADSLVEQYILNNQNKYQWTSNVNSYYRQYAGYTQFTPDKKIFINAFKIKNKKVSEEFLRSHLYYVFGGGSSFFNIRVNLQTKTCFDLRVNAPR